jgi:chitosanase
MNAIRIALILVAAGLFAPRSAQAAEDTRLTIEQLTSIFENSTPELQFTYCQNIRDRRGLTFGFAGFTSGTYDGTLFLREYRRLHPGNTLTRFLPAFERIDAGPHDDEGRNPITAGLADFPAAFRACGDDPLFRQAQQNLVDRLYWDPAARLARRTGARLPISRGEFYDTCINQGEDGLHDLIVATNRAMGGPPRDPAIPERAWLAKFLELRLALLRADATWKHAADRVRVYQRLLSEGNVRLARPIRLECYGDRFVLR